MHRSGFKEGGKERLNFLRGVCVCVCACVFSFFGFRGWGVN